MFLTTKELQSFFSISLVMCFANIHGFLMCFAELKMFEHNIRELFLRRTCKFMTEKYNATKCNSIFLLNEYSSSRLELILQQNCRVIQIIWSNSHNTFLHTNPLYLFMQNSTAKRHCSSMNVRNHDALQVQLKFIETFTSDYIIKKVA